MNICMIHGYSLRGTGSNLFVNELVRSFCKKGHNVFLFCQEREAKNIDFISEYYAFHDDNVHTDLMSKRKTRFPGKCILYNPNLQGLLPVYVYDEYKGFKVKVFTELKDSEIKNYITFNRQSIETVHEKANFDVIQSNHVVMSPYIARSVWKKHKVPYYITLHGSAFNFTVRSDPKKFNPYAEMSLLDAERIFAVSDYNRTEILSYFSNIASKIERKFTVTPIGVDTKTFKLLKGTKRKSINRLCSLLRKKIQKWNYGKTPELKSEFLKELRRATFEEIETLVIKYNNLYNHGYPDTDIVESLKNIKWEHDRIILFVGKYLQTKGIQIIISAFPFILKELPNIHALFVGFGRYREELEALVFALQSNNRRLFKYLNKRNFRFFSEGISSPFKFLEILEENGLDDLYFENAEKYSISEHIHFTGVLNHNELGFLLPCSDVFIATSIIPEAFGMVAIESLSCGIYPILSYEAGFREIRQILRLSFGDLLEHPEIYVDENMVFNLAGNILSVLKNKELKNRTLKSDLRSVTLEHFTWKAVCERYLHEYKQGLEREEIK